MIIETLKTRKRKHFWCALVVGVVLLITLVLTTSRAKYQTTQSIKIAEGTINYKVPDLNLVAMYIENENGEYVEASEVPTSGYTLNSTSYCTIPGDTETIADTSITMEYTNGALTFGNITKKGTKCYLYFDIKNGISVENILSMKTISTRTDFSTTLTTDTTGTIYTAEDDYGTSYYFAGNPTDNWVKFAGFYWRIIRINGDGTIRMIYQGTAANTTGEGTQTTTSAFNTSYDNNMYVGYMYTSGTVHGTGTASTIKGVLDPWYTSNLSGYASYIATGGGAAFCNDRQPSTSLSSLNGSGGTGTTTTYYAAEIRLYTNKAPTLKCETSGDRFSTSIGLITADEVYYAGGIYILSNSSFYLYTGQAYWTMSPIGYNSSTGSHIFYVDSAGGIDDTRVFSGYGVRPVINLKSDTKFAEGGTGTSSNPYVVN